MSQPFRLLELSGAPLHPSPLSESVLLLVDCQREYVDGALQLPGIAPALAEIAKLLALARKAETPVIHVVHHGRAGGKVFDPEGPFVGIAPKAAPLANEPVVGKGLPNSFAGTPLDAMLRRLERRELIVAGFMTHMCVSSTVRAALDLGYRTTVVARATATRDLPDGAGGVVPAEQVQRAELAALADRFAVVVGGADAWG